MGALLIADRPVFEARLTLPLVGVWHADLIVDDAEDITGSQTLNTGGGASWKGTARRPGAYAGTSRLRLVGGAGGMNTDAKAQGYQNPSVRQVLNDLLGAGGESLASDSSADVLNPTMTAWATLVRPIGIQIKALLETVAAEGVVFQMKADGTLFVGVPAFSDSTLTEFEIVHEDPQAGRLEIASPFPDLLPGTVLEGRRISYVEHTITGTKTRTVALYE